MSFSQNEINNMHFMLKKSIEDIEELKSEVITLKNEINILKSK